MAQYCIDCGTKVRGHSKKAIRCRSCYDKSRPKFWISEGYRFLRINGRDIPEHRYIMQQHLGRKLTSKEIVHHINGDTLDNRIDNLQIMTSSEHRRIHMLGSKRPHKQSTIEKIRERKKEWWKTHKVITVPS